MTLRVVVVDDEAPARRKIRQLLDAEPDVEVVGEYSDRSSAAGGIRADRPDLLFLDVQLRAETAFDVIQDVGLENLPPTVFVTAYDEHAVRAFDIHAVDYLLKPYDRQRFGMAMQRVRDRIAQRTVPGSLLKVLEDLREWTAAREPKDAPARWLRVRRVDNSSCLVAVQDIEWIEAAGNYVYIHTATERHLHRHPLGALAEQLDPAAFVRVHRSAIVNLAFIDRITPWGAGDYNIRLKSGTQVRLSRHFRDAFDRAVAGE